MKDSCVICGKETGYESSTHIDLRKNYIEGLGQMCSTCTQEMESAKPDDFSDSVKGVFVSSKQIKRIPNDFQLGLYVRMLYLDSLE